MGEKGPCNHCGIASTAIWRKGPEHKPILCNACGTKWRVRGGLDDYIPKHGFAEGYGIEVSHKDKPPYPVQDHEPKSLDHISKAQKLSNELKGDTSGGSYSNKHTKFESETDKEDSGLSQRGFWDSNIRRRKRSHVDESNLDPIRVLQQQLQDILKQPEFEHLCEGQEMLISPNNHIPSDKIGLGCVLLKSSDLKK